MFIEVYTSFAYNFSSFDFCLCCDSFAFISFVAGKNRFGCDVRVRRRKNAQGIRHKSFLLFANDFFFLLLPGDCYVFSCSSLDSRFQLTVLCHRQSAICRECQRKIRKKRRLTIFNARTNRKTIRFVSASAAAATTVIIIISVSDEASRCFFSFSFLLRCDQRAPSTIRRSQSQKRKINIASASENECETV